MNNTTTSALTLNDDADLEIFEYDRPTSRPFDFLGFSVHCSAPALGLCSTSAA
jgi:hypothetical protein